MAPTWYLGKRGAEISDPIDHGEDAKILEESPAKVIATYHKGTRAAVYMRPDPDLPWTRWDIELDVPYNAEGEAVFVARERSRTDREDSPSTLWSPFRWPASD